MPVITAIKRYAGLGLLAVAVGTAGVFALKEHQREDGSAVSVHANAIGMLNVRANSDTCRVSGNIPSVRAASHRSRTFDFNSGTLITRSGPHAEVQEFTSLRGAQDQARVRAAYALLPPNSCPTPRLPAA